MPWELDTGDGEHASQLLEGGVLHGGIHALVLVLQRVLCLLYVRGELLPD